MLSFSSLLSGGEGAGVQPPINERGEHISFSPSWKGGSQGNKKGTQSALSALTLLAFLFFLNMLQSCLRDQIQGNAPITIVMTTTTTTTTTTGRHKREIELPQAHKGEISGLKRAKLVRLRDSEKHSEVVDSFLARINHKRCLN